jgi:hypothetical protein
MLFEMKFESGLALEGLVALGAVHLSLGMSRKMPDIHGLDRSFKVTLLAPGLND